MPITPVLMAVPGTALIVIIRMGFALMVAAAHPADASHPESLPNATPHPIP